MNAEARPLRVRLRALAPACLLVLGGCGLKGPLYLPDREGQEVIAPVPVSTDAPRKRPVRPLPAPQSQKEPERENAEASEEPASPTPPPER